MADITELLDKATEIRDADTENENTALRVGQLLVDIIELLGSCMTQEEVIAAINQALSGFSDWAEKVPLVEADTRLLELINSRCVLLDAMGTDFNDGQEYTPVAGDRVYRNGYVWTWNGSGWDQGGTPPKKHVLYINLLTGRQYAWNGSSMVEIVNPNSGSGGGTTVTVSRYDGYVNIDIVDNTPAIEVSTQSLVTSGDNKSATFKVSGHNLKGAIQFSVSDANLTLSPSTLSPDSNGTVAETTVTVTYHGSADADDIITLSSPGAASKDISFIYSDIPVPTISASPATLSLKAAGGETDSATVAVSGINLEGNITAAITGADASKFQVIGSPITQSGGIASGDLTVTYSPAAGDDGPHEANLVLSSTNASSVTIPLAGAIAGTLSISPASANIGIPSGGSGTATFRVTGAHLTPGSSASVSIVGSDMAINKQTLTVQQNGTINEDVTVTFNGSAATNGTLSVSHTDVDTAAEATVTGAIVTPLPANASFTVDGIHYKVNTDQATVRVWNGSSESGAASTNRYSGAITIPASVSDSGVTANLDGGGTQAGAGCTYAVNKIGAYAFYNCSGVTSLTLPEGLETIAVLAMVNMTNNSFTSLTIPSTVTSIGGSFLLGCTKLTTLNMLCAQNVDFVDAWGSQYNPQLKNCSALTSFVIPDNITLGRADNYEGCTAIDTVTIGASAQALYAMFASSFMANVNTIICRGTTPPKINPTSSTSYSIPQSVYERAQVYVPRDYKQAYRDAEDGKGVNGVKPKMWDIFNTYHPLIEYDPD